jgi:hypothetical protein
MKKLYLILTILTYFQAGYCQDSYLNLLEVEEDSTLWFYLDKKKEHTIFGYSKPDTNSVKLIVISIFTYNVKNNPYNCKYGAYYGAAIFNDYTLKMTETEKKFISVNLIRNGAIIDKLYFERKWIKIK